MVGGIVPLFVDISLSRVVLREDKALATDGAIPL